MPMARRPPPVLVHLRINVLLGAGAGGGTSGAPTFKGRTNRRWRHRQRCSWRHLIEKRRRRRWNAGEPAHARVASLHWRHWRRWRHVHRRRYLSRRFKPGSGARVHRGLDGLLEAELLAAASAPPVPVAVPWWRTPAAAVLGVWKAGEHESSGNGVLLWRRQHFRRWSRPLAASAAITARGTGGVGGGPQRRRHRRRSGGALTLSRQRRWQRS